MYGRPTKSHENGVAKEDHESTRKKILKRIHKREEREKIMKKVREHRKKYIKRDRLDIFDDYI